MNRWRWALLALGGVLTALSLVFAIRAAVGHDRARAAWQREARRLPSRPAPPAEATRSSRDANPSQPSAAPLRSANRGAYDPARSDAHYRELRARRDEARRASWVAALGVLLAFVALGIRCPIEARPPAPRRAWLALLLDSALLASAAVLLTLLVDTLGLAHAGFGAILLALGASGLLGATLASLARGATLAMHLLGVRAVHGARSPGFLRALAALALLPLALLSAPLALIRPHSLPLNLRLAGLHVTPR